MAAIRFGSIRRCMNMVDYSNVQNCYDYLKSQGGIAYIDTRGGLSMEGNTLASF